MPKILIMAALAIAQPPPAPASALDQAEAQQAPAPQEELVKVALDTEAGRILLALDKGRAPVTTANFLRYVDSGRLNGINFYRAMQLWDGAGLVQAGVRDGARLYPPIRHEPTSETGLRHVDGTISMARGEPGSAQGDFFIIIGEVEGFDAGTKDGDGLGYAAFGRVIEGMDVVKSVLAAPVSPTKGAEHGMHGQILENPVRIVTARRLEN